MKSKNIYQQEATKETKPTYSMRKSCTQIEGHKTYLFPKIKIKWKKKDGLSMQMPTPMVFIVAGILPFHEKEKEKGPITWTKDFLGTKIYQILKK